MNRASAQPAMLAVAVALASAPVYAHRMDERYGAFLGSFLHPMTSLDHGLAFLALGLLAGQQSRAVASRLIVTFVLGLLLGALLSFCPIAGGSIAHLTTVNIASVVVLGGLVALARPLPLPLSMTLAGMFGLSHGFENASDAALELKSLKSVAGVVTGGLVASALFAVVAAIMQTKATWLRVAVRVIGSWAAAIGLIMLGFQLRQAPVKECETPITGLAINCVNTYVLHRKHPRPLGVGGGQGEVIHLGPDL